MLTDEEISMILNTYMYMDYKEADDGMTINEILSDLSTLDDYKEGGIHYGEYSVLSQAAENPEVGELIIGNQSHLMNFDSGTNACTFSTKDGSSIYVVFRGTGDGEWPDNGMGMTQASTIQQERALAYFETVVEREQITEAQKLVMTGHSKGANKAQYVVMSTKYDNLVDVCYNVDGQGFSEIAVDGWKAEHGEGYEERRNKIVGIFGENDYVNVLGNSIVAEDKMHFVKTPVKVDNFAGYHDIKYMFATLEKDPVTGEMVTVFHGRKNSYVDEKGKLGSYAALLSAAMMELPPEKRDGCAASLMQMMELAGDRKTGINGEKLTLSDIGDFLGTGVPLITKTLLFTAEGRDMLYQALGKKSFSRDVNGNITVMVNYSGILQQAQELLKMSERIKKYREEIESVRSRLPEFMKNSWLLCHKLGKEAEALDREIRELCKLSEMLENVTKIYMIKDNQAADEILML